MISLTAKKKAVKRIAFYLLALYRRILCGALDITMGIYTS